LQASSLLKESELESIVLGKVFCLQHGGVDSVEWMGISAEGGKVATMLKKFSLEVHKS
jgi:hypothetical protein